MFSKFSIIQKGGKASCFQEPIGVYIGVGGGGVKERGAPRVV